MAITVGSHSLSQIEMDNNNGQTTDFWVSKVGKQLNICQHLSTFVKTCTGLNVCFYLINLYTIVYNCIQQMWIYSLYEMPI